MSTSVLIKDGYHRTGPHLFPLLFAFLLSTVSAYALTEQELTQKLTTNFRPAKPTVIMTYQVTYRLLGMKLLSIAQATIEATEGYWTYTDATSNTPCCFIDITLKSKNCDAEAKRKGRIYINDRILSVATMPDLNTIFYVKRTDEYINPPFKAAKRIDSIAVYDLEEGELDFFSLNYLTDEVATNITGSSNMTEQGRELSQVLQLVSDVYHGRKELITPESDFRLQINCDGVAIPFAADTRLDHLKILKVKWPVLRAEVMPAAEAPKIKSREFRMWATSFSEVAKKLDDPILLQLAAEAPPWGMTPLLTDYGLALGKIRCAITAISTRPTTVIPKQLLSYADGSSVETIIDGKTRQTEL